MHKQRAKVRTYVLAIPMLQTETHFSDSCRCLYCGTSATAQSENKIAENCIGNYHYSAVSSLASLSYQFGMPSFRLEQMSSLVGIKVSDSTQWYLFEKSATLLIPFVTYLEKMVANVPVKQISLQAVKVKTPFVLAFTQQTSQRSFLKVKLCCIKQDFIMQVKC